MAYWNGTRMRTSWLRLRGNASGRTKDWRFVDWFCDGCQRKHPGRREQNVTLEGLHLCNRQDYRRMDGKPFIRTAQNSAAACD
jgi:hypothetical protein